MTNQEIRIAIAEKCGATWHWVHDHSGIFLTFKIWDGDQVHESEHLKALNKNRLLGSDIPDYPNDLNAMRDAVMTLSQDNTLRYWDNLNAMFIGDYESIDASAPQRSEAFLKVFGLWKD